MTDTLRYRALGALAVLRHTSHEDKADILSAYIAGLEAQPHVALDRAAQLLERGWRLVRNRNSSSALRFVHPRSFYKVHLQGNGDAEFWLKRVPRPHRIEAQDDKAFTEYIDAID